MTTLIININTFFPKLAAAAAKLNNYASDTVSIARTINFIY